MELIRRVFNEFSWQRAFLSSNVNKKVDVFKNTILNILNNFIPLEFAVCDDKGPPRFSKNIEALIQEKKYYF